MVSQQVKQDYEKTFYSGVQVKLGKHDQVDPGDSRSNNWVPSMSKYVGAGTQITGLLGVDAWGYMCAVVAIDNGSNHWRVFNMHNLTAGTKPPTDAAPTLTSTPAPAPTRQRKADGEVTVLDCLTDWNMKKIRELNKIAEERASIDPYA